MKIVLTASVEEPVPPLKYGGTERIVYHLANEYVRLGHDVYLLASGDSRSNAHLIPIVPTSIRNLDADRSTGKWRDYWKYVSVAREIEEIHRLKPDLVHNHFAWRFVTFEDLLPYPMMSTIHGPLTSVTETQTYIDHKGHPYVSISNNQRTALPTINWVGTVYNGIDIEAFPFNSSSHDREYFAFIGRTSPEKGLAEIIQMIRKTSYRLKIAAKVDEVDQEYFHTQVEPYIDGTQIEFIGEVDHDGKTRLLKNAKALLLWLNWEEPFGLVIPEANACGTPVIVNPRGAMPELVTDGKNGYLVHSIAGMQDKLDRVSTLSPTDCRLSVENRFTSVIMAKKYLELASTVIANYKSGWQQP